VSYGGGSGQGYVPFVKNRCKLRNNISQFCCAALSRTLFCQLKHVPKQHLWQILSGSNCRYFHTMTGKLKLDNVDRQILSDLQSDGRMTNVDLAKRAGISAPPCLRRVRVLEEGGIIRGYHADLDPESLGYSVQVFAFVGLTSQAETDLQDFEEMVSAWPQVRECHMLMGETDFLLKIAAHDWDDFQKFLTSRLTPAPNVSHVKTALSIRSAKNMPGVPVDGLEG